MRRKRGVYPSIAARQLGLRDSEDHRELERRGRLTEVYARALVLWGDKGE